jgi:ABC-2 type transport system permease protein
MQLKNILKETVFFRVIVNSIKEASAYRVNHLLSFLVILLPLIFVLALWDSVFTGKAMINGYSKSALITYYILSILLFDILYPGLNYNISSDIKVGKLSNFLIKPMNYLFYNFALRAGINLMYSVSSLFLTFIFIILFIDSFYFPSFWGLIFFFLSVFIAFILSYIISFTLSLISFWTEEITWLNVLIDIIVPVATGALIPVSFFPKTFSRIIYLSPFPYILNFPIDVYLSNRSDEEILSGFFIQILWLVIFYLAGKILWSYGLKKYQACGG